MKLLPRAVREAGATLIRRVRLPVRGGPNEGRLWSLASSGRGVLRGSWEAERLHAFAALVRPGECFWDMGAHKGWVTLAASRWVGPAGKVVAVEPAAVNLWFLRRHLEWNQAENVRVVSAAASDRDGEARFGGAPSSVAFHLGEGEEVVRTRSIRSLVENDGLPPPTFLKLDVERAEADALRGAGPWLADDLLVSISIHTRDLYHECREILVERGFRVHPSRRAAERLEHPDEPWAGDHEILAVGPGRRLPEAQVRRLELFSG